MAKIDITTIDTVRYEYINIPISLARAIITMLNECENDESDIVSTVSEVE